MKNESGVFSVDGDLFIPSPDARARWYSEALHGGPVAALFARQFERQIDTETSMVARLTVDLMRPVPTTPLRVDVQPVRRGRRIQVFNARMIAGDTEVAIASALVVRVAGVAVPEHPRRDPLPSPESLPVSELRPVGGRYFHTSSIEMRMAEGDFHETGPATAWIRLTRPIVTGEAPSALQLTAAAGDFGNGVSRVLDRDYVFMNPDVSIHLQRYPTGEWVALRSRTDIDGDGVGLAQSELFDEQGAIGHALQVLFVDTAESFGSG